MYVGPLSINHSNPMQISNETIKVYLLCKNKLFVDDCLLADQQRHTQEHTAGCIVSAHIQKRPTNRYISYISDVELICSRLLTGLGLPLNWSKMSTSSQLCPFREISIQDCFLIWRIITRSDRKLKHAPKILMTGIRLTSDQWWSVLSQQLIQAGLC